MSPYRFGDQRCKCAGRVQFLTGFDLADGPLQRATPPPASAGVNSRIVQDKFEIAENIIQVARRYLVQGFDLVYAENMVNDLIPEKA